MKVLLKKDVKKVGRTGDVVEVSDGYGANFLIPQGLGVLYTAEAIRERQRELEQEAQERARKTAEAQALAQKMEGVVFKFEAPVGNKGSMIGTISTKELKKALKEKLGIAVDKSDFPEHNLVNAFGVSHVKVELYKGVYGTMMVLVEPKPSGSSKK